MNLFNRIRRQNIPWKSILAILAIALAIFFITQEKDEVHQIKVTLLHASLGWVLAGLTITFIYIMLQGAMYYYSFRTIRSHMSFSSAVTLYLRRSVVSVFVPGGGVSSMAFFTSELEKQKITLTQNYLASIIYLLSGFATVVIIAIPALVYLLLKHNVAGYEIFGFGFVIAAVFVLGILVYSLFTRGLFYRLLQKYVPDYALVIDDLVTNQFDKRNFLKVLLCSLFIELTGIMHLWIAMIALGFTPSIETAVIGYVVVVVMLIASPFIKGIGPVEFMLTVVLKGYGLGTLAAISVTFLFRFFEFWSTLIVGIFSFVARKESLLYRVFPSIFLMVLGFINIFSVLTPPLTDRINFLHNYLPQSAINASNYLVIVIGIILILLSVFLFRGLFNAWVLAMILTFASLVGHLAKAIDYEEALLAMFTLVVLWSTRKQYYMRPDPKLQRIGIFTSLMVLLGVMIYGVVGFYFLKKRHFNIDFTFVNSVKATLSCFLLMSSGGLEPLTRFGRLFIYSINGTGTLAVLFFIYTMVHPYAKREQEETASEFALARDLVSKFGNSMLDYFKTYHDKELYFSGDKEAFVSFKVAGDYAVVLENPVAPNEEALRKIIIEFEAHCHNNNLNAAYYRVSEEGLKVHQEMNKRSMVIGQEAVVDLQKFSLDGGERKPMRNALNKVEKGGYICKVHEPPIKEGLMQKLKLVSDEWLLSGGKKEELFSQGMFEWNEIKNQTVLTVENVEEKVVAFINITPDYAPSEGTYDLQRKLQDAPNGVMDFVLIRMFDYFKSKGIRYVNLGMVPMSGIEKSKDFAEGAIKFMYEQLPQFAHYKGLRDYKDKFEPEWHNKYLVYSHTYDLLRLPPVLTRILKA